VVKGVFESIMDLLRILDYAFRPSAEPFLHPGKSADMVVSGVRVGFLGTLHPDIVERLPVKLSRHEIIVMEVDLDFLLLSVSEEVKYVPLPKYPHIDRDVALIVDALLPVSAVVEQMKTYPTDLIEEITIFDSYKGQNIPEGKKSLAFSIRYRAKDRTLTDSEIEELHSQLIGYVTGKTGGILRGT